jgi:phosphatidylserine decarboxylase
MSTGFHRSALFLRAYRFLPHRLLNGATARLARARRPRWLVQAAIDAWIRREEIDLADFQPEDYDTVERFFLRRLRPGARPIGEGVVSPCDGQIVDVGTIARGRTLMVKDRPISVERLVNGTRHGLPLDAYEGGSYAVIFLSPRGYHYVHMPAAGVVRDCQWIPGRYFPQNADALEHIDAVYERNERAVLRLDLDQGGEALMVMVGASLVGGIHLDGIARADWVKKHAVPLGQRRARGQEVGHFTFGSTVVLLFPRGAVRRLVPTPRAALRMGEPLYILKTSVASVG